MVREPDEHCETQVVFYWANVTRNHAAGPLFASDTASMASELS